MLASSIIPNMRVQGLVDSVLSHLPSPEEVGRVGLALSGGIDSAVTGWLLRQRGYRVTGVFLRSWDVDDGDSESDEDGGDVPYRGSHATCTARRERLHAEQIASRLGLDDFFEADLRSDYWTRVFQPLVDGYERGETPNPDLTCNRLIKFGVLQERLLSQGFRWMATGHYAQLEKADGFTMLRRARDRQKDQSFFLASVPRERFTRCLFPLGNIYKSDVRAIADSANLRLSQQVTSRGMCFIGKQKSFCDFIANHTSRRPQPGYFVSIDDQAPLQRHGGNMVFLTFGQRARIGGMSGRYYVVGKDMERSVVWVCRGLDHPSLEETQVTVETIYWDPCVSLPPKGLQCLVQTGSCNEGVPCLVHAIPGEGSSRLTVQYTRARRRTAPGQDVAFYTDDNQFCVGAARVEAS